jgi:hypothetical protein
MCAKSQSSIIMKVEMGFSDRKNCMEKNRHPYIVAALFCDQVLQGKDETISAIRIIDKVTVQVPFGLPEKTQPILQITLLLGVKSGSLIGDFKMTIRGNRPNGDVQDVASFPLKLQGEEKGQNYILNLSLGIQEDGVYWFEVVFEDEVITAIPLTVESKKPEPATTAGLQLAQ